MPHTRTFLTPAEVRTEIEILVERMNTVSHSMEDGISQTLIRGEHFMAELLMYDITGLHFNIYMADPVELPVSIWQMMRGYQLEARSGETLMTGTVSDFKGWGLVIVFADITAADLATVQLRLLPVD